MRSRLLATVIAGLILVALPTADAAATSPAVPPLPPLPAPAFPGTAPAFPGTAPAFPGTGPLPGLLGRLALAAPSPGCVLGNPAAMNGRLPSGRRYVMHLPKRYDGRRPYPVLLAYHGRGQQARDIQRYSGLDAADAVVLYPQGRAVRGPRSTTAWEGTRDIPVDGKDVAFTRELLATAGRSLCLDTRKVTAVGASQGGGFAHVLACSAPGTVSAIAAVAGAFYRPQAGGLKTCASGPLRVLEFHGTADPVIDDKGTKRSLPIRDWLAGWATRNDCVGRPALRSIPPDVTEQNWTRCAPGSQLTRYLITKGNHGWPGAAAASVAGGGVRTGTISATTIILRFAAGRPLDPASTGTSAAPVTARPAVR